MNPIKITTVNTDEPLLGKSKWWGAPDLPASVPFPYTTYIDEDGEEYPQPLTFICQIRLRDIADIDTDNLLPHTGMLYFFADIERKCFIVLCNRMPYNITHQFPELCHAFFRGKGIYR